MAQVADHQRYQFLRGIVNFGVHDRHVELLLGGQLHPRRGEPALPLIRTLRPAALQPAYQLLPARRRQEDHERLRHRGLHLPGSLEVDLQQRRPSGVERLVHRGARGAVTGGAVHDGPLQQLVLLDHPVELRLGDEPVVHSVLLVRAGRPGGRRHRDPDLGMVRPDVRRDRTLADGGRTRQDRQPRAARRSASAHSPGCELALERRDLLRAETPHAATLGDADPLHQLLGAHLADAGHRAEQVDDPHLADHVVLLPSCSTSEIEAPEFFRRFFTSARSRREAAALSRAAWRCSGVSGGRAKAHPLSNGVRRGMSAGRQSSQHRHRAAT